jgi:Na+-translocating ferredoxin:NAD+ oxidoreductase RnfG subunit
MDIFSLLMIFTAGFMLILAIVFFASFIIKKTKATQKKTIEIKKETKNEVIKESVKEESRIDNVQEESERDIMEKVGLYYEDGSKIEIAENSPYSKKIVELADKIFEKKENT